MEYSTNRLTGEIVKAESLGGFYTTENWKKSTQGEINNLLLQEAKNNKISEIKSLKSQTIYLPIEYNGSTFINSEISSNALKIVKDETDEPIELLGLQGLAINLTKVEASELLGLMITHRKDIYFKEAAFMLRVASATSIGEVDNIAVNYSRQDN